MSSTGPKSCPLKPVTVGKVPVRQSFKPFSNGHVPNSCSERAEGSWHLLQCQGELATVSAASENAKPIPITMPPSGRKKSWLRVVRRVATRGSAQYRGKWWTLKQIPAHDLAYVRQCTGNFRSGTSRTGTSRKPQQTGPTLTRHASLKTRSVQFFCWNAGGLPTQCYDEILQYSRANALDVIALVETRRRQSMLWTSSEYTAVQSGEDKPQQSYAGILLLVKNVASLRYEHVVPGRLLHAHVTRHDLPVPLDILVVYQKWIDEAADANAMELATEVRHHVWNELDRTLAKVPRRHSLLVLDDFNTRVAKSLPVFSSGDPSLSYSSDSDLFTSICHRHRLHHCHRAQGASGTTYRYARKDVGSRIDYALVRSSMRPCCTTSSLEWSLPFLAPNDTGYHCVLRGGFRTSWTSWRTGTTSTLRSAPIVLDQDLLRCTQRCEHSLHQRYQELLAVRCHAHMSLDVMCDTVHETALEVFGKPRRQKPPPPWASSELTSLCQRKWNAFAALRKCSRDSSLASIFSNWSAIALVMRITRQYKQMGRKLRRCWLETLLDEAKTLAEARDPSFFRVIRTLSPKSARSPYGTRCKLSAASSMQDEIACFAEHYKTLFAASSPNDVLAKPSWQWLQQCSSTVLDTYFAKIPLFKSVPSGHCIGAAWRIALQTSPIRSCLDKVISDMPSSGIPARFCNGNLILLPKPGKSGKEVNHYRPLVLQCPLGKAILRWAASCIFSLVRPRLLQHPQFAYLQGRSAEMAIHRVQSFLDHRRKLAGYAIVPPLWARAGWTPPVCTGCLVVALDLPQAFDRVNRVTLIHSLRALSVPEDLVGLIWAWHQNPEYILRVGDLEEHLPTTRGVRQGCTIAPLLWLIFLHCILEDLYVKCPGVDWLSVLTAFADDLILCFAIDKAGDLKWALEKLQLFLQHLSDAGLIVNMTKTQMMLRLVGTQSAKVRAKHTLMKQGKRFLRLASKDTHELCDIMTYGLSAVGLADKDKHALHSSVMRFLRRIMKSPSHITHESDDALLRRIGVLAPISKIALGCCRLLRRMLITLDPEVCPSGWLRTSLMMHCNMQSTWWRTCLIGLAMLKFPFPAGYSLDTVLEFLRSCPEETLHEAWHIPKKDDHPSEQLAITNVVAEYTCPDCGKVFYSYTQLRSHQRHSFCT